MLRRTGQGPWLLAAAVALGVLVTPFAFAAGEGRPVDIGERNPSAGSASKETQIIARTPINTYGTRQSNLGAGGGAIYGCRTALGTAPGDPKSSTPCVRINNLQRGLAFQFQSLGGTLVGTIQAGPSLTVANPAAKPFITNATGVADGLNADKVDGLDAATIVAQARQTSPLSGAPSFAFARVLANGTTDASRTQGVADSNIQHTTTGVYCFYGLSSRPKNAQATLDGVNGEVAVDTTTTNDAGCAAGPNLEVIVRTYDSAGAPADKPFQLALTGGGA